ncbi:hypothetical protein Q1695_011752 [Nippostrongylus brasiliensis]|nr:hypothetical protein Q1695_011752 [Nippostrongylus brasiliensis]
MAGIRWWMLSAVLVTLVTSCYAAQFGAMSIDFGSQFLKVGLIKPGVPMEIVLNKESHRKTPNIVSIRNGERLFGDAAQAVAVRYPSSVYGHLIDLVAKHTDHPSVALFRQRFPNLNLEKHVNESSVVFPIGDTSYPVEVLLAMILTNVREFTETYAEMSIRDVVISVPVFFTQAERLIVEKAAQIAKLNLLQLINDGTSAGLNYGMFRRKEITEKPQRLLIFDMGASKTVTTLVEYKLAKSNGGKDPKMTVLGVGFDRYLGGLEMTQRLRDLLVRKFNEHYKSSKDITTSERAMAKLLKEAERLKQVLSANADYYAQVESVHEDIDMRVHVTREEFNKLIEDLLVRVKGPMEQALEMAELKLEEVDQVVLMGAGTRVPKVQEEIQKFIGSKELGRFLNTDEAIAMGALYQAAHLSKGFKVKAFGVEDLVVFPIQVNFISKQKQDDGSIVEKPITRQVIQYKAKYPTNKKTITFTSYTDDFTFDLNYSDLKHFDAEQTRGFDSLVPHVTTVSVSGVGKALEDKLKPEESEFVGVKVGFQTDLSGILRIEKAEAVIQRKSQGVVESITKTISGFFTKKAEEGEPTDAEEKKEDDAAEPAATEEKPEPAEEKTPAPEEKATKEEEKKTEDAKEETAEEKKEQKPEGTEEKAGEEAKPDAGNTTEKANATADAAKEKPKVPEVIRVTLKTNEKYTNAHMMSKQDIADATKILEQFEKRERQARERAAAENELEALAFEVTQLVEEEDYVKHSTEAERTKMLNESKRIRTWLEDETSPETKTSEFTKNTIELRNLLRPIKLRITESGTIGPALENLKAMLNSSRVMAGMGGDDEKALFNKTDADAFSAKLDKLESWLKEKLDAQEKHKLHEDPAVMTSEVVAKIKALERELNVFMRKMRQARVKDMEDMMKKDSNKSDEKAAGDEKEGGAKVDEPKAEDASAEKTHGEAETTTAETREKPEVSPEEKEQEKKSKDDSINETDKEEPTKVEL